MRTIEICTNLDGSMMDAGKAGPAGAAAAAAAGGAEGTGTDPTSSAA
jgi:hypothetical protein